MAKISKRIRKTPPALGGERFELAMRAINEGVYDWDVANGSIYYSEAVYAVLHMPRSVKTPEGWRRRIHPDDLAAYDAAIVAHFRKKTRRFECDYRYQARDRTWRWARQHGIAIRDKRGRVVRVIGSTGDITELKRVELALAESRERYALATWAATEGIYEWNLVTGTLYLSDRAKTFFGVKGIRLTPAAWNARVHRDDFPGYRAALEAYFKGRTPQFEHEYRIRNNAGGYFWVIDRAAAVRDAKRRVVRLVGAIADVTQRKQAEMELRRARDEATEALERQTVTAEILRVMAGSPSDVQPVFDAIASGATRLCDASFCIVFRYDGAQISVAADDGRIPGTLNVIRAAYPAPPGKQSIAARAILERRAISIADAQNLPGHAQQSKRAKAIGYRSILAVPMMKGDAAVGSINVARLEVNPFTDAQIDLLKTFADQAVIAIENVRLFNETKESLERQTATAEILKVIASSPADVRPVFDAILRSAVNLCGAEIAAVFPYDGKLVHLGATYNWSEEAKQYFSGVYPAPPSPTLLSGRTILGKSIVKLTDAADDAHYDPNSVVTGQWRRMLGVPILREGEPLGALVVSWREPGDTPQRQVELLQTFADQAVIAIENVRLFNETREALERQTATAEVLEVISRSPTNVQPVFEAIVSSAALLFKCSTGIQMLEGDKLYLRATAAGAGIGQVPLEVVQKLYPLPLNEAPLASRAIASGKMVEVLDSEAPDLPERFKLIMRAAGSRSGTLMPLTNEKVGIGTIILTRPEPGFRLNDSQKTLLQTFARQAVIAIENVRLFNETKESLERQTATAEILKVIASSPSDVQPVFEAIVRSGVRLFEDAAVAVSRPEGSEVRLMAIAETDRERSEKWKKSFPFPLTENYMQAAAILRCAMVEVADAAQEQEDFVEGRRNFLRTGYRALTAAPMVRDGVAIGTITVVRVAPGPLTDKQKALLRTFADQAVIAIENVRLFNETREALERQTATAEILRVMASSPSDVRPVLDTVAERAAHLCESTNVTVMLLEGGALVTRATFSREAGTEPPRDHQVAVDRSLTAGRAVVERRTVHVEDVVPLLDSEYPGARENQKRFGFRTVLAVPMIREGTAVGVIYAWRREVRPFAEAQIALVETFASQAVIAIENVRLFNETKEALERQTATAEILKVIASSPSDVQPVLEAIVRSAAKLFPTCNAFVFMRDGGLVRLRAMDGVTVDDRLREDLGRVYPVPFDPEISSSARAMAERRPNACADTEAPEVPEHIRRAGRAARFRSNIVVPLVRDDEGIGTIVLTDPRPGHVLDEKQLALLNTFADQAVIAIENVRLFNETKEALERQVATGEVLAAMSGSMTDTQPVFDKIVQSLRRLFGTRFTVLQILRGDMVEMPAVDGVGIESLRERYPRPIDETTVGGRAMLTKQPVQFAPVLDNPATPQATIQFAKDFDFNSVIFTPMIHEGRVIGAIGAAHTDAKAFDERQIALIRTFADQAVIAIENVRLFNETKEALERQTATAEILKVIASSPSDVQPVFDVIVSSAQRLIKARVATVARRDGDTLYLGAYTRGSAEDDTTTNLFPMKIAGQGPMGRAILDRRPSVVSDVETFEGFSEEFRQGALKRGSRSMLSVPLLRGNEAIGAINVSRSVAGAFTAHEIGLLTSFADQAAIAMENVRLFNETREALERQTATAEILKVIASSPSDVQPVFDAIARSSQQLLGGHSAAVTRVVGDQLHLVSITATSPAGNERLQSDFPQSIAKGSSILAKSVREAISFAVADIESAPQDLPVLREAARARGFRSVVVVPMIRDGNVVGTVSVTRKEPGPFADHQISLLKTFADQAVIAIENVRLFNETKEALERQTATAEILKVISSSPTDTQPVFDAIVQSGMRLFSGAGVGIGIVNGDEVVIQAAVGMGGAGRGFRMPLSRESASGLAILEHKVVNIPDTEALGVPPHARENGRRLKIRSMTQAPMFREGEPIGSIGVMLKEPGGLDDKQLALLKTFADQAVIAIENVRLFKELQSRTEALTKSVGQLTALGEVGQAISSTLDLETVLQTIVSHAVQLTGLDAGGIYEYDEQSELFTLRAAQNMSDEILEFLRSNPIKKGEGAVGTTAVTREPVQVTETLDESYQSRLREIMVRAGRRAILAVPLLREGHIIGALAVQKTTPGAFAPEVVELLKTFATQSAMAIQNARLFREIAEKGKQLEIASQHKSNFLASMSHELRTPLNAILGFNEMILGQVYGEVPADMQEPLTDIQTSGKHLLRLINNVLDLAKIEAGRMELSLQDYSVHDTVASVHSTLRPLAAEKGLEFLAHVPNEIPLAYGDGGRIAQCLMNLAGNSLKFTKAGKVEILVEARDGLLVYKVADTGIGIPPDKIGSLFTEFKQTDATIASEYGGTGLGLSISRKFVEMHGGRIWVESELGKGSAFIFEIPLRMNS